MEAIVLTIPKINMTHRTYTRLIWNISKNLTYDNNQAFEPNFLESAIDEYNRNNRKSLLNHKKSPIQNYNLKEILL